MSGRVIDQVNGRGAENQVLLKLGNNKLVFAQNQRWIVEDSDLDVAAAEILRLVEENKLLRKTNVDISNKLESSARETEEMARLNDITMHMLTEERRKKMLLEQEVFAYKEELKKSFATIVQLRQHLNDDE